MARSAGADDRAGAALEGLGAGLGNPFPVTVYIGHVGWKSLGARLGYSFASGFTMLIIGLFGLSSLLLSIVPMAAVAPILIYIGIVSANQAVRETSKEEIPIFFIALFPWIANWATTLVGNTLKASGTTAGEVGADKLNAAGVDWLGLTGLGNGAPLLSILLGCIAIFAIRNQTLNAALMALVSAVMVFFGIIHTAHVGILQPGSVPFLLAYGIIAAICLLKWFLERNEPATVEPAPRRPRWRAPPRARPTSSRLRTSPSSRRADRSSLRSRQARRPRRRRACRFVRGGEGGLRRRWPAPPRPPR